MSATNATVPTNVTASVDDEDVVVLDVRQLVGDHAFKFHAVELFEQAGGDGHRRVLRIASCREGVRCRVVDDVDARLGQTAGDAQALDEVVQPAVLLWVGRLCPRHSEGDAVGLPVRGERCGAGDEHGDDDAPPAETDEVTGDEADRGGDSTKAATSATDRRLFDRISSNIDVRTFRN